MPSPSEPPLPHETGPSGAPPVLGDYGWTPAVAEAYEPFAGPDRHLGRIIRVDRGEANVVWSGGMARCDVSRPPADDSSVPGPPATGDWVAVSPGATPMWTLEAILPRHSVLDRLAPDGTGRQIMVSNLDTVLVVSPLDLPIKPGLVDRAIVVAWESDSTPVLVLTKADLVKGGVDGPAVADAVALAAEVSPDIAIIPASAVTGFGIESLRALIHGGDTVALIGPSGGGKSTLINALVGNDDLDTGATRDDGAGRHTTTARELVPMPGGAVLIDTPGVRSLGLSDQTAGLARAFADLEALAAACRFRDCSHDSEPGCAVTGALESGELSERRLRSYRQLEEELALEEQRNEIRRRRTESREARRTQSEAEDQGLW